MISWKIPILLHRIILRPQHCGLDPLRGQNSVNMDAIFVDARDQFLQALPVDLLSELGTCKSAKELVESVRHWDVIAKSKRRGLRLLKPIQKFSGALFPYFKIVDLLVNSNPEFASLAWGAFRLALQVSSSILVSSEDPLRDSY